MNIMPRLSVDDNTVTIEKSRKIHDLATVYDDKFVASKGDDVLYVFDVREQPLKSNSPLSRPLADAYHRSAIQTEFGKIHTQWRQSRIQEKIIVPGFGIFESYVLVETGEWAIEEADLPEIAAPFTDSIPHSPLQRPFESFEKKERLPPDRLYADYAHLAKTKKTYTSHIVSEHETLALYRLQHHGHRQAAQRLATIIEDYYEDGITIQPESIESFIDFFLTNNPRYPGPGIFCDDNGILSLQWSIPQGINQAAHDLDPYGLLNLDFVAENQIDCIINVDNVYEKQSVSPDEVMTKIKPFLQRLDC